jgi:cell wall-associated NlpC family hydrolase
MPIDPAAPRRPFPRMALALVLGLAVCPAFAAPGEAVDPLMKLVAEQAQSAEPVAAPVDAPVERASLLRQVHDRASDMVVAAMNFVGVRYRRGGVSAETGFDCSGFTRHVFETNLGLVLPRRADEQAVAPGLLAVKREDLRPGDLVFFNTLKRTFSHVGIYVGDNRFIHSPRPGQRIRTEDMSFAYWAKRFTGARRVDSADGREPSALLPTAIPPVAGE